MNLASHLRSHFLAVDSWQSSSAAVSAIGCWTRTTAGLWYPKLLSNHSNYRLDIAIRLPSNRYRASEAGRSEAKADPCQPDGFGAGALRGTTRGGTMKVSRVQTLILLLIALVLPACDVARQTQGDARKITADERQPQDDARKITVAVVQSKSATIKQSYQCRIDSQRPVFVHSPVEGRVAAILVKEGQAVKRGDPLFEVGPPRDEEKPEAEDRDKVVSIKAPCDGLVRRLPGPRAGRPCRQGRARGDLVRRQRDVGPFRHARETLPRTA